MNWQEMYFRVYEKGKWYVSKRRVHTSKGEQSQLLLPALVSPMTRFSMREKVWLSIGVFLGIVSILAVIVSMQIGARQAMAHKKVSSVATPISSSTRYGYMPRTTIPNPPPVSLGKLPSTLPATPVPAARPTPAVVVTNPTPTLCPGVNCNPWGYNFVPGNLIYNPPADFCNYFACTPNFNKPHVIHSGYVVECADGMYSQFVGRRATCIFHGGMLRPLYTH